MNAALLLLADGRFPAGGHAHSGGVEAAVAAGAVRDAASLERFLTGRLHTAGLTAAGLTAAAARAAQTAHAADSAEFADLADLAELDQAAEARTASPALRAASRRLGRQLLRAAQACWPDPVLGRLAVEFPGGAHHPVVLGITARAAGLTDRQAAGVAAYESVNGPATAAVRLLGLDPYQVVALLARLAPQVDAVAAEAVCALDAGRVPSASAPLLDVYAERHHSWKVKLFAS
ncbi:urease accessory protein UreF [Kitasatospora azatica]|uniref:urease accessory protein UreF n=1 Tax=Kitasatospora azatica TaxID=58347 RepID=UPI00055BA48D|nr:urease accessory UreF family protein [Kitasatospora azatica]